MQAGNQRVEGRKFLVCPGLLDNNTIAGSGIVTRLMYTSIMLQDDARFIGDTLSQFNLAEMYLAKIRETWDFFLASLFIYRNL